MINSTEIQISNKSYTNKDFAQIYPELLALCKKLTNNWDPERSNESDPGIVLLKLAAFIADKNNYNIDKNVLECFMPSATQETSMRNLCEMNGYNMRYYRSAITPLSFLYNGTATDADGKKKLPFILNKYDTVISSADGKIKYTLIDDCTISEINTTYNNIKAIEGTIKDLVINDSSTIQLDNIDDNNRLYLPDHYVAENGIFINNVNDNEQWIKVDSLMNTELNNKVFKFSYDSSRALPYIEFPSDIAYLIGSGLNIKYIISSGLVGNVSANTLTVLFAPDSVTNSNGIVIDDLLDYLTINNLSSANDGLDPETIDEAYNSFKKTIGTFNTLVTCRDYANFIYNLVDETTLKYIVSNIQVADRRDDINHSNNVVTYDLAKNKHLVHLEDTNTVTPYDLYIYPLSPISANQNEKTYNKTFKPLVASSDILNLDPNLNYVKCISHDFKYPSNEEVFCLKNYYTLNVYLGTNSKLDLSQQEEVINDVKLALYKKFNAREIDFGEELIFKDIEDTIYGANSSIVDVRLSIPEIKTKVMNGIGTEVDIDADDDFAKNLAKNLVIKNVLNGTIELFNKIKSYSLDLGQSSAGGIQVLEYWPLSSKPSDWDTNYFNYYRKYNDQYIKLTQPVEWEANKYYKDVWTSPINTLDVFHNIASASTETSISKNNLTHGYTLQENETIQFIAPNLTTEKSFGAYVNYRFSNTDDTNKSIPANTLYQLEGNDELTFIYTDSETNIEHKIIYKASTINTDGVSTKVEQNIFKSTFEISQSTEGKATITKDNVAYLVIGTSDSIDRVVSVKTLLTNSSLNCYWITNKANNTLFDKKDAVNGKIEVLLQNNEYFMYSNSTLTELVILGSGTKLTLDVSHININNFVNWTIPEEELIDIEDISSNGLAAFGTLGFKTEFLTNTPLLIEEMQIKSFSEGDIVTIQQGEETLDFSALTNDWVDMKDAIITANVDGVITTLDNLSNTNVSGWKGHSRLDLNCGPLTKQKVLTNHTIILEDIEGQKWKIHPTTTEKNPVLSFNYLTQFLGGENIKVSSRTVNGITITLSEGIEGLFVNEQPITYGDDNNKIEVSRTDEGWLIFDTSKFSKEAGSDNYKVDLPLVSPSKTSIGDYLICIYYDKSSDINLKIEADTGNIKFYGSESNGNNSSWLTLKAGLNTICVSETQQTSNLKIYYESTDPASIKDQLFVGIINVIDGLNKIIMTSSKPASLTENIIVNGINDASLVDHNSIFYWTNNTIQDKEMDITDIFDAEALWDKNNVFNKFTIAEIDFDNSEFNILRGSKK